MTKVKVTREVAKAIEFLRQTRTTDYEIIANLSTLWDSEGHSDNLRGWAFKGAGSPVLLMRALVSGYETEKSPEERVRDRYAQILVWKREHRKFGEYGAADGRADGFRMALEALGIKIEGVNA